MNMEKSKGERQTYLAHLMTLAKDNCLGAFKEILKLRLSGDHEKSFCTEKYGEIISPPLTRDEYEENQLIVYAYNLLKEDNQQKSIECLREVVVDLLIEALSDDEQEQQKQVSYIKELSYLMVSINVEEATELAEKVRTFVWSRLEQLDLFSDSSDDVRFGCAHRTFDVWLIVTPQTSCEETCKRKLQTLFQKNIQKNIVYPMQFKFLLLMFRAVVKFDRYFAGRIAFFALSQKIERENQERLIRSFSNLCWELGILIKQPVEELESFLQGLAAVPKPDRDTTLASPIFIQALSRMELPESQLPSDIGFVLAFNRIANQIISQFKTEEMLWKQRKLRRLNTEGVIIALEKIWEPYYSLSLFQFADIEDILRGFMVYYIFAQELTPKLLDRSQHYRFSEERDFVEYLMKKWSMKQPHEGFKRTSDKSQICYPIDHERYVSIPFSVRASTVVGITPQDYMNSEEVPSNDIVILFNTTDYYDNKQSSTPPLCRAA